MLNQKIPNNWEEREKLRQKGQFWTPEWVAKAMVAYTIKNTNLIFDPAAGRGAFFDALLKLDSSITYWGIDIDPNVLQDEIYQNNSCITELRDFLKTPPQQKFQSIIANPPYIRHHRLNAEIKQFLKALCQKITGFTIDGRAGYHIYFLIQALHLLKNNGRLAFIMPADTCEGIFAKKLWQWITKHYCLDCVVTFGEDVTPFPNVDTNAMIFFIQKVEPRTSFKWVKVNDYHQHELCDFVNSDFQNQKYLTLKIIDRDLSEALETGLSRPQQHSNNFKYHLHDFAQVMRGIATGANEFFFLTKEQVEELKINLEFFKVAIGRTKDILGDRVTTDDVIELQNKKRPTFLLSINGHDNIPASLIDYIRQGEKMGLHQRPLLKQRKCWYKMEYRDVPPILFAYLGRRNLRFIKNEAGVLPLTSFLCIYPIHSDEIYIDNLWEALNHPDTIQNLKLVGKSYGSGAIKVEPQSLNKLPIPEHIVEKYQLNGRNKQVKFQQIELF